VDIEVAGALNFEEQELYEVLVEVTDSSGKTLTRPFALIVLDANDAPTALQVDKLSIEENAGAGAVVGSVFATDEDSAQQLACAVPAEGDNGWFAVTFADGVNLLTVARDARLDYEAQEQHQASVIPSPAFFPAVHVAFPAVPDSLQWLSAVGLIWLTQGWFAHRTRTVFQVRIRCTDNGTPPLSVERTFVITVVDVNERPTAVSLSPASVSEDAAGGLVVGTLSAADEDRQETFTFLLRDSAGGLFALANGDQITLASSGLDYESQTQHNITVTAVDSGQNSITVTLIISVIDANDSPTDLALTNNTLDESSGPGTVIGILSVSDQDTNQGVTFATAGATDVAMFGVRGNELLFVGAKGSLDFESVAGYEVTVTATDTGFLASANPKTIQATFAIAVTDSNDPPTAPIISSTSVNENQPVGTIVGVVSATDVDAGDVLTFTLEAAAEVPLALADDRLCGQADGVVECRQSLVTTAVLDYEAVSNNTVGLAVLDAAGVRSSRDAITITVNDINDAPRLRGDGVIAMSVAENSARGTVLQSVLLGNDEDAGQTLACAVATGAGDGLFVVDGENRLVVGNASLDFEATASYTIPIVCTDNGTPAKSIEGSVALAVTDVNEAPSDVHMSSTTVAEDAGEGTVVGVLTTTDQDAGDTHNYQLTVVGPFRLQVSDQLETAVIVSSDSALNYEVKSSYQLTVTSFDLGQYWVMGDQTATHWQPTAALTLPRVPASRFTPLCLPLRIPVPSKLPFPVCSNA